MHSSNARKHRQSGFCWSLFLLIVYLSEVNTLLSKHPVVESDILSLFGSEFCIPGTLNAVAQSTPSGGASHRQQVQEAKVSSTGTVKEIKLEEMTVDGMTKEKTPMCLVNELARHNKIEHQYRLTGEEGPAHKKKFKVTLRLGTEEYTAEGPSIKKTQHSAASIALQHTNYRHPPPKNLKQQNRPGKGNITPTVELNALAMKRGEPTTYTFMELPPTPPQHGNYGHRGMYTQAYNDPYGSYQYGSNRGKPNFRHQSGRNQRHPINPAPNVKAFKVKLKVGEKEFIGEGPTAQAAKHDAASKALNVVRELPVNPVANVLQPKSEVNGVEADSSSELKSPISLVHEIALKRSLTVSFDVVSEKGPPHMRTFVTKCTVGETEATAEGNGKKISKKRAAEKMLELLRKLPPIAPTAATTNPGRVKRKGAQNKKKPRNLIKDTKPSAEVSQPKEEKVEAESSEDMNPISKLIQIQQAKKEKEPIYILKEERGAPRRREFLIQVSVGDTSYVGSGPNKKIAKRNAAEGLLQVLGYSSSALDREAGALPQAQAAVEPQTPAANPGGPKGRQIVPGLLLMNNDKAPMTSNSHSGVSLKATAAVAKEYLNSQAVAASQNEVHPMRPSEQLEYLSKELNFKLQYTDFRKSSQNEYLSLVSLSTDPPQVCHGSGPNTDVSKDQAALAALRSLAEMGLDYIANTHKKPQETIPTNVGLNATTLNATSANHEMYMALVKEDGFLNGK